VVLDCFVGSGTSAVAAILERRQFIGVDTCERYVQMSARALDVAIHDVLSKMDLCRPAEIDPTEDCRYHPVTGQAQFILDESTRKYQQV
jgi:hypothetical protein